ncbi:Protease synthase and sporulation protein PAI 2 [Pseudomonas sp. 37 R 15]|uniref:FMN-binding negative transcriptional regulator n=1 Tax=Pseudomonas sp. 37 R 15 TaxID=1844104 RepID=UPI0008124BA1|nr:FMN-binding negative transcriptional regulator [Pseudomonas sp. 37 R 15]CRM57049.1 Protease synthase and sporulation protein PAI 2 [Pseudomonas sp. 37 R 15]
MSVCPFHYPQYRSTDPEMINRFIDVFPLAMMTSHKHGHFLCSHIPLWRQPDGSLFGHVDGNNPQFKGEQHLSAQIVFMGPSAYIPPHAYVSRQLPTWNYLAVHMQANITVVDAPDQTLEILEQTAKRLSKQASDYQVDKRDPRVISSLPHILGLVIRPETIEGRFKLSQDKSSPDTSAALQWLLDNQTQDHAEFLKELLHAATQQHSN